MTPARRFITRRTKFAATLGAAAGVVASTVTGTWVIAALYNSVLSSVARAQATADAVVADHAQFRTDVKDDLREIRADVKSLLQQRKTP